MPRLYFMVQLGQADGHFAAARAGSRDNDQWALGFDVIIFAVTVIAHNASHIVGVASNFVMAEGTDVQLIQAALKASTSGAAVYMVMHTLPTNRPMPWNASIRRRTSWS